MREILPIDVASLGVEGVVGQHTLVARPCVEGQQGTNLLQFLVGFRPRAEASPDADHQVGIVLVHILHHFLRTLQARLQTFSLIFGGHLLQVVGQVFLPSRVAYFINVIRILEAHGIPVGVAAPILPVLNDSIEWNLQLAVFVEHRGELVAGLIALAALPMAQSPEREHRCLTRQLTDAGDNTVLRAVAVDEVVVDARSHLAGESSRHLSFGAHFASASSSSWCGHVRLLRGKTLKPALTGIVPINAIATRRGEVGDGDVAVVVP